MGGEGELEQIKGRLFIGSRREHSSHWRPPIHGNLLLGLEHVVWVRMLAVSKCLNTTNLLPGSLVPIAFQETGDFGLPCDGAGV